MVYPPPPWYGVLTYPCFTHHLGDAGVLACACFTHHLLDTGVLACPCFTHHLLDTSVFVWHTILIPVSLLALVLPTIYLIPVSLFYTPSWYQCPCLPLFYPPSTWYRCLCLTHHLATSVLACPCFTHHLLDTGVFVWHTISLIPVSLLALVLPTIYLIPVFLFNTPSPWYQCPCLPLFDSPSPWYLCSCLTHHLLHTGVLACPCLHVSHIIFLISVLLALVLHMILLSSTQTECSFHLRKKTKEAADNH